MDRTRIWVCVHCDLDLGDMTLRQGHDTPLGHGQQLCEILSRSDRGKKLWPGQDMNRRTDRQGDSYPPPPTLFAEYNGI